MEVKVNCPLCNGSGKKDGSGKGNIVVCWHCHGTGKILKVEELRGLLFEAMFQDSVNLRQKLLWTEVESDLIAAGDKQIEILEDALESANTTILDDDNEKGEMIKEYSSQLKNFKEWFEIFKMDLQLIVALRNGSGAFTDDDWNYIDTNSWILRGNQNGK